MLLALFLGFLYLPKSLANPIEGQTWRVVAKSCGETPQTLSQPEAYLIDNMLLARIWVSTKTETEQCTRVFAYSRQPQNIRFATNPAYQEEGALVTKAQRELCKSNASNAPNRSTIGILNSVPSPYTIKLQGKQLALEIKNAAECAGQALQVLLTK